MLLADRTSCTAASSLPCRRRCANSCHGSQRSSNLARCGCEGCCSFGQASRVRRRRATATSPSSAATAAVSSMACAAPRSTSCARCPALSRRRSMSVGSTDDLRRWLRLRPWAGHHVQADVLCSVLGELGAEGLRRKPLLLRPQGPLLPALRRPRCANGPSGSPARSSLPKRFPPRPWRIRAKSLSVASAGVRKPSSGIAFRGVCCRGCGFWSSLDRRGKGSPTQCSPQPARSAGAGAARARRSALTERARHAHAGEAVGLRPADGGRERIGMKSEMMSPEPRNEPQMLRWFRKTYPSYDLQPLLLSASGNWRTRAFNNWLGERRLAQEGQRHGGSAPPAALRARRA